MQSKGLPDQTSMLSEELPVAVPRVLFSEEVIVKIPLDPQNIQVKICYSINEHTHEMLRTREEPVGNVLRRIGIRVDQSLRGSTKKKKAMRTKDRDAAQVNEVLLLVGGKPIDESTPNSSAWVEGAVLQVGSQKSRVRVNPPAVVNLDISTYCMAGHAVVARVDVEFADVSKSLWTWRRCDDTNDLFDPKSHCTRHWSIVGNECIYWPTQEDVGHRLVVECVPVSTNGDHGASQKCWTQEVITPPTNPFPCAKIHARTPNFLDADHLRVVSYNILADVYASSEHGRENLYSYCAHHSVDPLAIDYRQCLIECELLGYHADIICLQELGERCYNQYLQPVLEQKGFSCHYKMKEGQVLEGVGIALRKARLEPVEQIGISFTEFLLKDPSAEGLLKELRRYPRLLSFLAGKHSVVLIVIAKVVSETVDMETKELEGVLRNGNLSTHSRYVAVATTHLYYHPEGDHIRLLQTHIAVSILKRAIDNFQVKMAIRGERNFVVAPIFTGDFNSSPLNGVYEYFINGSVEKEHSDWKAAPIYETVKYRKHLQWVAERGSKLSNSVQGGENICDVVPDMLANAGIPEPRTIFNVTADLPHPEVFPGIALDHPFQFVCASGLPMYTNFTAGFVDTLDYIYVDGTHFDAKEDNLFPTHEDVIENKALPSYKFPSDHIALISNLKWK